MLILPISIQHVASVALARRIVRDIVGLSKAEVASYCWRGISSSVNKPVIHPLCHFIIIVCVFFFFAFLYYKHLNLAVLLHMIIIFFSMKVKATSIGNKLSGIWQQNTASNFSMPYSRVWREKLVNYSMFNY